MPRHRFAVTMLAGSFLAAASAHADTLFTACYGCHGDQGISVGEHIPSISGLNFRYFYATMQGFKNGKRHATVMDRIAKGYRTSQLQRMALFFGSQPWTGKTGGSDPELARQGKTLHDQYCEKCHKHNGHFQDKDTPPLAGQAKGYLLLQMADYRAGATATPPPAVMQERLELLNDAELRALAEFYAGELAVRTDRNAQ